MKRTFLSIILIFCILSLLKNETSAQSIRQMQYNLLYYTENGAGDCDQTTNNLDTKDQAFKCLVKYVQPDVLTVNELGKGNVYPQRILDNVLNTDGVNYFAFAPTVSNPNVNISIGNGLFYDTRKLVLHSTFYVATTVCYFNAYRMYYRSNELAQGDTAFITFIVSHLKAGTECESNRFDQVKQLMNRLVSIGKADNYVLSGDFNIYNASEDAYQHLVHHTNPVVRFYDPIDREGEWDDNSAFADLFTQSTHSGSTSGCFSGGGMDNRFDFILVSDFVLNGTQKVRCLPSTYQALGQDGHRHNGAINSPTNNSVPAPVVNALYAMSDHLPVILEYELEATLAIDEPESQLPLTITNPVTDQLTIYPNLDHEKQLQIGIYSIDGKLLYQESRYAFSAPITIGFPFPSAIYFVKITDNKGVSITKKVVK